MSIDVEPNKVPQTSVVMFGEEGKMFSNKYPIANVPTESIARNESPLIFEYCDEHKSIIAQTIVTGITTIISLFTLSTFAIANAPNATWESPSPINEYLLKTSVTPRIEADKAIRIPIISA